MPRCEFEASVAAQWLGAGTAVALGGTASLVSTAWVASRTPQLRAYQFG